MSCYVFGPLFAEIAALAAEDIRAEPDGTFLYGQAGPGWVEAALFKDLGNRVIYREGSEELFMKILEAWEAEDADKKWTMLQMDLHNGRFDVKFTYEDELDPDEMDIDRRERILVARYGEKPVDYEDP